MALGNPPLLPGPDRDTLAAVPGPVRIDLEMDGVFHAVAPVEAVPAHNLHDLSAVARQSPMTTTSGCHATQINGQTGFMH